MTQILITGGCGFAGHHLVEHVLRNTDWSVIVLDRLSYASRGFDRLRDIEAYDDKRVRRFTHDFTLPIKDGLLYELQGVNYVVHMGAETHVDNSIADPTPFVMSNVVGTMQMLEYARIADLTKFIYFSTDEVFGPAHSHGAYHPSVVSQFLKHYQSYSEWDRYNSTNPYSATKAAGEELCLAYANTYALPIVITHTMNLFGERQHPEKFIPGTIRKVLNGQTVTIHSDSGRTRAGSRYYLHARNAADACVFLCSYGERRDKYNIVGQREVDNLELAQLIARVLEKPLKYEMVDFHSTRPGHDLRYALDGTKMAALGWEHPVSFIESLIKTVHWFVDPKNKKWLEDYNVGKSQTLCQASIGA